MATAESDGQLPKSRWLRVSGSRHSLCLLQPSLPGEQSYYHALEAASRQNEITNWLAWFGGVTIEAQRRTLALIEFLIEKTKLFDRLKGQLNDRQQKALLRMFKEGPDGFKGGLSAGKYSTITGASPATATRDLVDLTEKGALVRTGRTQTCALQSVGAFEASTARDR